MLPALVVYGHNLRFRKRVGSLYAVVRSHGEGERSDYRDPRRSHEQHRNANRKTLRHLSNSVKPDRITREISRAFRRIRRSHYETRHRSPAEIGGPMLRGRSSDPKNLSVGSGNFDALPGEEPDCISAEALCSFHRGDHAGNDGQKLAAGVVKIVEMMIVAEQNEIHAAQRLGSNSRSDCLFEYHRSVFIFSARRIKRWISQQAEAAPFEQGCGSTDVRVPVP